MRDDRSQGIFWLGVLILVIFVILLGSMLFGCYSLLSGGMEIKDNSVIAVVFTLLGSILGSVGALAAQVGNYYYGSSHTNTLNEPDTHKKNN